jgi:hypothetical protein
MIAPSICIPRIFDNSITKNKIYTVFNKYNWGPISRIDLVNKNNNTRVFIHFKYWFDNQKNLDIKEKLLKGESINIIYAKPWFWKCSVSKIPKP